MSDLPSFLKQTAPNTFELTLSPSAAEAFMLCPAKYSWSRITGIEAATPRAGMNYGKAIHLLFAALYSGKPFDAAAILSDHFAANPQPELGAGGKPEWRNAARALQSFNAYRERYASEDFAVIGVEEPFEVTLGEFTIRSVSIDERESGILATPPTTVTIRLRGIRDLRVRWHDAIWVLDHKTSTEWGDSAVDEGRASFQFMCYAWVERLLAAGGERVGGVIGNYIISRPPYAEGRKPTPRDLPRDQFERVPYPYSDAQLDEWQVRAMRLGRRLWDAFTNQEWDQHSTACGHWGRCEYYQLCWETDPAYRLSAALGADFRPRTPSPFEEEAK